MNDRSYLEQMVKLGISETEAKIYLALLAKRELSAREIHELTNVPRTKVYEITQKMILKGMCIAKKMGRRMKFQAVEPKRAFSKLVLEYQNELENRKKLASKLGELLLPLYDQGMKNIDVSEYIEVITDISSIHERYVSLLKNTKFELLGFAKPPYAFGGKRSKLEEQESAEFEMLSRGVEVRILYEYGSVQDLDTLLEHIKKCILRGEKARVIEKLPLKMYVFDRKYVLMALENKKTENSSLTMIVVEHSGLGKATSILFDHLWSKAKDYRELEVLTGRSHEYMDYL